MKIPAGPAATPLREVHDFGSNPGALRMFAYLPAALAPGSALVVVLHGCTQTAAGYDFGAGWSTLADRYGFALVFPEQQRSNNPNGCFNWFLPGDTERDRGEAHSIRQMVARAIADHGLDRQARLCHRPVGRRRDDLGHARDLSRRLRRRRDHCRPALWRRQQCPAGVRKHVPEPAAPGARVGRSGAGRIATFRAVAARFGLAWRQRRHRDPGQRGRDHQAMDRCAWTAGSSSRTETGRWLSTSSLVRRRRRRTHRVLYDHQHGARHPARRSAPPTINAAPPAPFCSMSGFPRPITSRNSGDSPNGGAPRNRNYPA